MLKTDEKFDITWQDASRLSCLGRCECRYMFKCLMGLQQPKCDFGMIEHPSYVSGYIALDYGTVMHAVLPYMYDADVTKPFEVFENLWAKYPYGQSDPKRNTPLTQSRIVDFVGKHTPANGTYTIEHFAFSNPATELISDNEVPFLIDVGAEYLLAGRIDNVIRLHATNSIWAYDFKTSSEISDRYYGNFWNAPQPIVYTIALSQITDKPVDGLVLEVMRISKTKIETQYREIYVSEINIRQFLQEYKLDCARIQAANETGIWRQRNALCSSYSSFGSPGFTCEYKNICDADDWREAAEYYERKKPFNPLEMEMAK